MSDEQAATAMQNALMSNAGVVGFSPRDDALFHNTSFGCRVYYYRDGEIRWVSRNNTGQDTWSAPTTMDTDQFTEVTTEVEEDDFKLIDKRVFDWLVEDALADVDNAHEGLAWGICQTFGDSPDYWSGTDMHTLRSVPGIGDKIAGEVHRAVKETETSPTDRAHDETPAHD